MQILSNPISSNVRESPKFTHLMVNQRRGTRWPDGDVRFKTGNGNMAVSCCAMKIMQRNRYYMNSLVIMDLAIGQILRSTERIST